MTSVLSQELFTTDGHPGGGEESAAQMTNRFGFALGLLELAVEDGEPLSPADLLLVRDNLAQAAAMLRLVALGQRPDLRPNGFDLQAWQAAGRPDFKAALCRACGGGGVVSGLREQNG